MMYEYYWMIAAAVFAVISMISLYLAIKSLRSNRLLSEQLQRHIERSQREVLMLNNSAVGIGKRVVALDQELNKLKSNSVAEKESSAETETLEKGFPDCGLSDAQKLLNAGVAPEEVAKRCDISQAEANLMNLMKAPRNSQVA